jgi:hypothetical protein
MNNKENIFSVWVKWQFWETPKFLILAWGNYFMFASNYFSLPILLKTFFSPWRRYRWNYPKGFDVAEFFNTLISNTVSRILGAFMRIILIITGICFQAFVALAGLLVLLFWIFCPLIALSGFLFVLLY